MGFNDIIKKFQERKQQKKEAEKTVTPKDKTTQKDTGQKLEQKQAQIKDTKAVQAPAKQEGEKLKAQGVTQGKQYTPPPPEKQKSDSTNERYRAKELNKSDLNKAAKDIGAQMQKQGVTADKSSNAQKIVAKHSPSVPKQPSPQKDRGRER